jgi:HSP20 family protein
MGIYPKHVSRPASADRDFEGLAARLFRDRSPAVDMFNGRDEVLVRVDLAGLRERDIEVSVENGTLTIRGERKEAHEASEENYYCGERWSGSFGRSLVLPPQVDAEKIRATFKNGILEIHLPKIKEAMGRRIQIEAA